MARQFSKNTANRVVLPANALGAALNGSAGITVAAWVYLLTATAAQDDNQAFVAFMNGATNSGLATLNCGASTTVPKVTFGARSAAADARTRVVGATAVPFNAYHHWCGISNYATGTTRVFLDGVLDAGPTAVTFAGTTFANGTASTVGDSPGGYFTTTPLTGDQLDGHMAELAVWLGDIGDANVRALGADAYSPRLIRPDILWAHWQMLGEEAFADFISGVNGTITGSIPISGIAHPRIIRG